VETLSQEKLDELENLYQYSHLTDPSAKKRKKSQLVDAKWRARQTLRGVSERQAKTTAYNKKNGTNFSTREQCRVHKWNEEDPDNKFKRFSLLANHNVSVKSEGKFETTHQQDNHSVFVKSEGKFENRRQQENHSVFVKSEGKFENTTQQNNFLIKVASGGAVQNVSQLNEINKLTKEADDAAADEATMRAAFPNGGTLVNAFLELRVGHSGRHFTPVIKPFTSKDAAEIKAAAKTKTHLAFQLLQSEGLFC
jgi:hypothetical protein